MEEKLNEKYGEIAKTLNETIPEEWDRVLLYGEINEDIRTAFFNYYPVGGNESVYSHDIPNLFNISRSQYKESLRQILDILEEIWREFKINEEEVWTNITFILESTGKFKIDYDYTDLSDASPRKQHIIWDYKYLGIMPTDENDKKVIEEYLRTQK
ncbi:UNVERIFIED_CONTAM: uncharacterized protein (TIGR01741 family) [Acetivibrio alkalicellulosi]